METKMTARTTTTDLGKIVLMPGGEYSPDKTYEERTFVLYQNSTYVALQTVTGIEPSNDLVNWQLMAKGFAGSETQIEGYVFVDNEEVIAPAADPALDADKLGGNLPDYYAPQHEISDAYSDAKSYVAGDYCIYLNALYRFTKDKEAGAWDGSAVIPATLSSEIQGAKEEIERINGNLFDNATRYLNLQTQYAVPASIYKKVGNAFFLLIRVHNSGAVFSQARHDIGYLPEEICPQFNLCFPIYATSEIGGVYNRNAGCIIFNNGRIVIDNYLYNDVKEFFIVQSWIK